MGCMQYTIPEAKEHVFEKKTGTRNCERHILGEHNQYVLEIWEIASALY